MKPDDSRPARILVLYHSQDGHTKMMADLVAEGAAAVPATEVRLKNVAEAIADDLVWCDGVAAGSPTHMGTMAWEMKRWWDVTVQPLWPKVEGKIGCAFSSSGGLAGGGELTCLALQIVLMNYGFLVFGIPDYVAPGQDTALRRHLCRPAAQRRRTRSLSPSGPAPVRMGADVDLPSARARPAQGDLRPVCGLIKI